MLLRECLNCNKEFKTYPSINSKCCSKVCSNDLKRKTKFERLKKVCQVCGVEFLPKHSKAPGFTCSYECDAARRRSERITSGNYVRVNSPDHPNKSQQGFVLEHRLVMEEQIGRYLTPEEVVHHLDFNPMNNDISNLFIMTDSSHKSYHARVRDADKEKAYAINREFFGSRVAMQVSYM